MSYAIFENIEEFNTWHEAIKAELNYPLVGFNEATKEPDYENLTVDFTVPNTNPDDIRVLANVEDYTDGLTIVDKSEFADWFKNPLLGNYEAPSL